MGGPVRVLLTAAVVMAGTLSDAGPAGAAGPYCGDVLTADTTLTADLSCGGDGLIVAAPGVTLDLGGHTLTGPGRRRFPATETAVSVSATGVTVRNGTIQDFVSGVSSSGPRTHVSGLSVVRTQVGVTLGSDGNHIRGNLVANTGTGVRLDGDDNLIDGNALRRTGLGVIVARGSNNRVAGNSIVGDGNPDYGIFLTSLSSGTEVSGNSVSGQPGRTGIHATGFDSRVTGNQVFGNLDGISVRWGTVTGNMVFSNLEDGIDLELSASVVVSGNTAFGNRHLGIRGGSGAVDGGGNRAFRNGDPRQCTGVVCSP